MITFEPLIPSSLWITLAIAGVVLLVWYALRRPEIITARRWGAIVTCMGIAYLLVLLLLANLTLVEPVPPPPGKPLITVLVDNSPSMNVPDAANGATRLSEAKAIAADIQKLAGEMEVQLRVFSDTASPASPDSLSARRPQGASTDVAGSIVSVIEPDRPRGQAIVLLTDGIQTAEGGAGALRDAALAAKSAGTPIYARSFGGEGVGRDLALDPRNAQELAFVRQKVPLHLSLRSRGYTGEATVHIMSDGKEIASRKVGIRADESINVAFDVSQERAGLFPYEVRVDPIAGEMTEANNSATMMLRTVDRPVRVLLIEGKPYWDSKFLTRLLSLDASVELHTEVKIAPGRIMQRKLGRTSLDAPTTAAATQNNPSDTWKIVSDAAETLSNAKELSTYQIVLLGRDAEEFLTDPAVSNLQRWISRDGGALVCYRGAPTSQANLAVARLLPVKSAPVRETRFHLKLTDTGRDLNFFSGDGGALSGLPALAVASAVQQTKPLSVILATSTGDSSPTISYQPYGAGRVVMIEGAGMWRWAFLPKGEVADDTYSSLWHGLFRWLVSNAGLPPGIDAMLRADKVSFPLDTPATATVLVRPDAGSTAPIEAPKVELRGPAGTTSIASVPMGDDPGAYRVNFGKLAEGRYEAKLAGENSDAARIVFDVRRFGEEQLNLSARPDLLKMVAELSDGAILGDKATDEVAKKFDAHLKNARPPRMIRTIAWDRWWILVGVFVFWSVSWMLRRSSGLV